MTETKDVTRHRLAGKYDEWGHWSAICLEPHESGEWVSYLAYRKVRNELATLRAQLAGVRERVEKLQRWESTTEYDVAVMYRDSYGNYLSRDAVLAALDGAA